MPLGRFKNNSALTNAHSIITRSDLLVRVTAISWRKKTSTAYFIFLNDKKEKYGCGSK